MGYEGPHNHCEGEQANCTLSGASGVVPHCISSALTNSEARAPLLFLLALLQQCRAGGENGGKCQEEPAHRGSIFIRDDAGRCRETLSDMIREDLVAERIAIESYSEIVRYLGDDDPTSRRVMEEVLAKEEEHAEDMSTLLQKIEKESRERTG